MFDLSWSSIADRSAIGNGLCPETIDKDIRCQLPVGHPRSHYCEVPGVDRPIRWGPYHTGPDRSRPARWDERTPTGHVYKTPVTADEIWAKASTFAHGVIEQWDPCEMPPEPTWQMIGTLLASTTWNPCTESLPAVDEIFTADVVIKTVGRADTEGSHPRRAGSCRVFHTGERVPEPVEPEYVWLVLPDWIL